MKPIYKPAGRALEYAPDALACNIYTGCPHKCYYCFSPTVLHKDREAFHSCVEPRKGIVEAAKRQLEAEQITNRLIHLCFSCDPYPIGYDTTPTREIIKAIKAAGNHVQILTKGGKLAERDFDLLDEDDWFGVTCTGIEEGGLFHPVPSEPNAAPYIERLMTLEVAHKLGINTWVSCEPVLVERDIFSLIEIADYIDLFRIGKLNYHTSDIDWGSFGHICEWLCQSYGRDYYIKADLRVEMERGGKDDKTTDWPQSTAP